MPMVTVAAGAVILDEVVTPSMIYGGTLVLVGVYVGAFVKPKLQPPPTPVLPPDCPQLPEQPAPVSRA